VSRKINTTHLHKSEGDYITQAIKFRILKIYQKIIYSILGNIADILLDKFYILGIV